MNTVSRTTGKSAPTGVTMPIDLPPEKRLPAWLEAAIDLALRPGSHALGWPAPCSGSAAARSIVDGSDSVFGSPIWRCVWGGVARLRRPYK
jgi:hypothetical protein